MIFTRVNSELVWSKEHRTSLQVCIQFLKECVKVVHMNGDKHS